MFIPIIQSLSTGQQLVVLFLAAIQLSVLILWIRSEERKRKAKRTQHHTHKKKDSH